MAFLGPTHGQGSYTTVKVKACLGGYTKMSQLRESDLPKLKAALQRLIEANL